MEMLIAFLVIGCDVIDALVDGRKALAAAKLIRRPSLLRYGGLEVKLAFFVFGGGPLPTFGGGALGR